MKISVGLNASLRRFIPDGAEGSPFALEVPAGATAAEVMQRLGIPADRTHVVTVDGTQVETSTVIAEGQEVSFFPPLAGGR